MEKIIYSEVTKVKITSWSSRKFLVGHYTFTVNNVTFFFFDARKLVKKLTLIAEIKNCFSLFVLFSMDRTLVHVYNYAVVMVRGARKGNDYAGVRVLLHSFPIVLFVWLILLKEVIEDIFGSQWEELIPRLFKWKKKIPCCRGKNKKVAFMRSWECH